MTWPHPSIHPTSIHLSTEKRKKILKKRYPTRSPNPSSDPPVSSPPPPPPDLVLPPTADLNQGRRRSNPLPARKPFLLPSADLVVLLTHRLPRPSVPSPCLPTLRPLPPASIPQIQSTQPRCPSTPYCPPWPPPPPPRTNPPPRHGGASVAATLPCRLRPPLPLRGLLRIRILPAAGADTGWRRRRQRAHRRARALLPCPPRRRRQLGERWRMCVRR
ncbi:hypothetical protein VPH35_067489 [Triticum aestivum]